MIVFLFELFCGWLGSESKALNIKTHTKTSRTLAGVTHWWSTVARLVHRGRHTRSCWSLQSRDECNRHCWHHTGLFLNGERRTFTSGLSFGFMKLMDLWQSTFRQTFMENESSRRKASWPVCLWGDTTIMSIRPSTLASTVSLLRPVCLSTRWMDLVCQSVQ